MEAESRIHIKLCISSLLSSCFLACESVVDMDHILGDGQTTVMPALLHLTFSSFPKYPFIRIHTCDVQLGRHYPILN